MPQELLSEVVAVPVIPVFPIKLYVYNAHKPRPGSTTYLLTHLQQTVMKLESGDELRNAGEIDLSRKEDSVMSLTVAGKSGKQTLVYAGINSSKEDIAKDNNQHLRIVAIESGKKSSKKDAGSDELKVTESSRTSLFQNPGKDTYQRQVRVSGGVGIASSAFGKEHQLAIFKTGGKPQLKGLLELPAEAEAADIIQSGKDEWLVAYCFKHELYLVRLGKETGTPQLIFTIPTDEPIRPVFRNLRFLSPKFLLGVANMPNHSKALLQGFRLPANENENARLAVTAKIARKILTTSLDVVNLSPPSTPYATIGDAQFVVAVGARDSSISLFTLQHRSSSSIDLLYDLLPLYTLKNVHEMVNISGLAFSRFIAPTKSNSPQSINLASISLESSIAIHSIPLKEVKDDKPRSKGAPPAPSRYVVAMKSQSAGVGRRAISLATILVVLIAVVYQVVMEGYGRADPLLAPSFHGKLSAQHRINKLLQEQFLSNIAGPDQAAGETLVIRETEHKAQVVVEDQEAPAADDVDAIVEQVVKKLEVDVHDHEVHGPGKSWDELGHAQQAAWKERLYDAGHWTQQMGENVFKGILFGEIGGAVGHAMHG